MLCVDNYFTGSKQNVASCLDNPRFELMRHDVTFPLYVEVDEIYNLACPASPIHYQHDPVQTTKTSVHGAINMLGLAKRTRAKIFQASTSEVYGDPTVHPQVEGYCGNVNPLGPRACYDEGKRCAETLFFDYWRQHKLRIKVARIFNTYGPRMHPNDGRVVSNFIVQALKGEAITHLRRRHADPRLLLRRRPDRRLAAPDGPHAGRFHRPGQSRQSGRDADQASRREGHQDWSAASRSSSRPGRCRSTIPCSAAPTSPWRATSSNGSPRSPSNRVSPRPSSISTACCAATRR